MSQHRAKSIWMVALALALAACGSQKREEAKPADPAAAVAEPAAPAAAAAAERPLIEGLGAHSMTITTRSPLAQTLLRPGPAARRTASTTTRRCAPSRGGGTARSRVRDVRSGASRSRSARTSTRRWTRARTLPARGRGRERAGARAEGDAAGAGVHRGAGRRVTRPSPTRTARRSTAPTPTPMRDGRAAVPGRPRRAALTAEALMDLAAVGLLDQGRRAEADDRRDRGARSRACSRATRTTPARTTTTSTPSRRRAIRAARCRARSACRTLAPGAGHLVHMPAHIYMRVGRYDDARRRPTSAARGRRGVHRAVRRRGVYPAMYYPHNLHFLWASATMEGRSARRARDRGEARTRDADAARRSSSSRRSRSRCRPRTTRWCASAAGTRSWPSRAAGREPALRDRHVALRARHRARRPRARSTTRARSTRKLDGVAAAEARRSKRRCSSRRPRRRSCSSIARRVLTAEIAARDGKHAERARRARDRHGARGLAALHRAAAVVLPGAPRSGSTLLSMNEPAEAEVVYREDLGATPRTAGRSSVSPRVCARRASPLTRSRSASKRRGPPRTSSSRSRASEPGACTRGSSVSSGWKVAAQIAPGRDQRRARRPRGRAPRRRGPRARCAARG